MNNAIHCEWQDGSEDEQGDDDLTKQTLRETVLGEIESKGETGPCCGVWWGPISFLVVLWCKFLEIVAPFLAKRLPCFKPQFIQDAVSKAYKAVGKGLVLINSAVLKAIIWLVLPDKDSAYSYFDCAMLFVSAIFILSLACQTENFQAYKCGCPELQKIEDAVPCSYSKPAPCDGDRQCAGGLCVSTWAETPCVNPWANPSLALQEKRLGLTGVLTSSADAWASNRTFYCAYSRYLHFILLGCAFLFAVEFFLKFTAHQGPSRFFLLPKVENASKEKAKKKKTSDQPVKPSIMKTVMNIILGPFTGMLARLNNRNIVDSLCIVVTVGGVVITDLTFQAQVPFLPISMVFSYAVVSFTKNKS